MVFQRNRYGHFFSLTLHKRPLYATMAKKLHTQTNDHALRKELEGFGGNAILKNGNFVDLLPKIEF